MKDRLVFYDEVVAVEKDGIYLIVTISREEAQISAGGLFLNDEDYNNFIGTHDRLAIDGSTFYLKKDYSSISALEEEHSGPAMWGSLNEYIPEKSVNGNVFQAYEQVIKKKGHMYSFIIVGEQDGTTPSLIQSDIKEILESIKW